MKFRVSWADRAEHVEAQVDASSAQDAATKAAEQSNIPVGTTVWVESSERYTIGATASKIEGKN